MTIANLIKQERERLDLTQEELATRLDMSSLDLARIEAGIHPARINRLVQLTNIFEVDDDFFTGHEETHTTAQTTGMMICHARIGLKWRQTDLAVESGIGVYRISDFEAGIGVPDVEECKMLSKLLGVTFVPEEVVDLEEDTTYEAIPRTLVKYALENHVPFSILPMIMRIHDKFGLPDEWEKIHLIVEDYNSFLKGNLFDKAFTGVAERIIEVREIGY